MFGVISIVSRNFLNKKIFFLIFFSLFFNVLKPKSKVSDTTKDVITSALAGGLIFAGLAYLDNKAQKKEEKRLKKLQNDNFNVSYEGKKEAKKDKDKKKNIDEQNKVYFSDIAGIDNVLVEVREVVEFAKHPEKFEALGAKMPKGILLEGPPGNGKTLIAKAIANESGCNFLYVSGSSFVEMYVGVGAKRVRELFEQARDKKPTIVFIDEIDAIGAVSRGAGANEEYRQTLNELLCQLDGFKPEDKILVLAATNNANALDKALKRPGRFTRIIKVPNPDKDARFAILNYYINKLPKIDIAKSYIQSLAERTVGFSGADLENIINEAAMLAVRDGSDLIKTTHLEDAFKKELNKK